MRRLFQILLVLLLIVVLAGVVAIIAAESIPYSEPEELADDNGQFATIDGARVYYVTAGNPEDPAVILIHGFGGSTFTWRDQMQPLADAGYYAVALDLPPFGLSEKSSDLDYSRSWMADIVAGLMDELELQSASIVGHSMGGGVTGQFAVRHIERVDKLVFVAGGVSNGERRPANDEDQESSGGGSPLALLQSVPPDFPLATTALRLILTPDQFTNILRSAYERKEVITDETIAGYQRALKIRDWPIGLIAFQQVGEMAPVSLDDLAAAVDNKPVMLIWGNADSWVPVQLGEEMARALPDASFVRYDGIGHLPMEENTSAFTEDLIAFLSE